MGEGREAELVTHFHFLLRVAIEVMFPRELDARRVRGEGLDDDLALQLSPPCPSGDLGDELESPFPRAEIRDVQAEVGV